MTGLGGRRWAMDGKREDGYTDRAKGALLAKDARL